MADVSVKMGVSGISQFRSEITQAQASVKTYDSALKLAEKQFRATGNAQQYMQDKTTALQGKLAAQKSAVKSAEAALKSMTESGVNPASQAYQKMQQSLLNAQAAVLDTQNDINNLGTESADAAGKTDQLATSLGGLNKKLSLDQVISGIDSITTGLENANRHAVQLGESLFNALMDKARWADDTATMALMYGIDLETFERMQKLVTNGLDTSVESMLTSMDKMKRGVGNGTKATMDALKELGLVTTVYGGKTSEGMDRLVTEDSMDLFFRAGKALMEMGDAYDKEAAAQAIFGRSWKELVPLFDTFKSVEDYNKALEETTITSAEDVEALAELNDKVSELKGNFDTLATDVMAQLAPALTRAADSLNGLLENLLEYLETPEGKQALEDMGKAVEGLFSDLTEIDPEQVVQGFADIFNGIVSGIQWLDENKDTVIKAMEAIVLGWAGLKVTGGVLDVVKIVSGLKGLTASGTATAAGSAAGSAWGGAFAAAVMKAAPWLVGLYTLLNPSAGSDAIGNNNIYDTNGNITQEGAQAIMDFWERNPDQWQKRLIAVGNRYGDLGSLSKNEQAMNIMLYVDNEEEMFRQLEEQLGLKPMEVETVPVAPEGAAEELAAQIGPVTVPVQLVPDAGGGAGNGYGGIRYMMHANGLWSVPFDGYMAVLHKGERVVPAREVSGSRTFNSNLYVESMYMNNGQDADGLAARVAAENQRIMSGFGS